MSWGDGQRIVQLGALGEALGKLCGEGGSSTLDLRNTGSEKKMWFFMCKVCGMWRVTQYKNKQVSSCEKERSTSVQCTR